MVTYAKLFSDILASTIWAEPPATRLVWITLLAMADRDGIVQASVPGLAHMARVGNSECELALAVLGAPDPYSRTKDHEGRRIEPVPGGWLVLNYEKHNARASMEEKRERDRLRQERKRERDASRKVTDVTESRLSSVPVPVPVPEEVQNTRAARVADIDFERFWSAYDKKVERKDAVKAWKRLNPDGNLVLKILAAVPPYVAATPDKQYRKNPATWLNGSCWDDEIIQPNNGRAHKPVTHIQNMPLGSPACSCAECVQFRAKKVSP